MYHQLFHFSEVIEEELSSKFASVLGESFRSSELYNNTMRKLFVAKCGGTLLDNLINAEEVLKSKRWYPNPSKSESFDENSIQYYLIKSHGLGLFDPEPRIKKFYNSIVNMSDFNNINLQIKIYASHTNARVLSQDSEFQLLWNCLHPKYRDIMKSNTKNSSWIEKRNLDELKCEIGRTLFSSDSERESLKCSKIEKSINLLDNEATISSISDTTTTEILSTLSSLNKTNTTILEFLKTNFKDSPTTLGNQPYNRPQNTFNRNNFSPNFNHVPYNNTSNLSSKPYNYQSHNPNSNHTPYNNNNNFSSKQNNYQQHYASKPNFNPRDRFFKHQQQPYQQKRWNYNYSNNDKGVRVVSMDAEEFEHIQDTYINSVSDDNGDKVWNYEHYVNDKGINMVSMDAYDFHELQESYMNAISLGNPAITGSSSSSTGEGQESA
jgi:hypothetical protein